MNNKPMIRSVMIWVILVMISVFFFSMINKNVAQEKEVKFNEFIAAVESDQVDSVTYEGQEIHGKFKDTNTAKGQLFVSFGDTGSDYYKKILKDHKLVPNYVPQVQGGGWFVQLLLGSLPILLFVGFFWYASKKMGAANGKISSFGKVNLSSIGNGNTTVKFADVAGSDEAKEELTEIVDFLKNPASYTNLGARIPKGALLIGPPGVGKTMLAKATANEAGVPFYAISGSEFIEMFVGVGASRVRDMFDTARRTAPCIIFIDEIDAVAKARSQGGQYGGSNSEADQTLNQLLTEMDGIDEKNKQIIVLAATNRPEILDEALLRPGRFDRRVTFQLPDIKGREQILKTHARDKKIDPKVDFHLLARGTSGMSGADLANLLNEAALLSARRKMDIITTSVIEDAKDKITMGTERRSVVVKDSERERTAYHESGHALVSKVLAHDTVHKISIVPRGMALGVTHMVPDDNQVSYSKEKAMNIICVLMGGRAAEEIVFNEQTTGASDDIKKATNIARRMVTEWGMGDFGPMNLAMPEGFETSKLSSETMRAIDQEVKGILNKCYDKTKQILTENREAMVKVVGLLMKKETITGEEMNEILIDPSIVI